MSLAERLKAARIRVGLSQAALARKAGIAQPSLHSLESGKSKSMRDSTLLRIANALGQQPDWLAVGIDRDDNFLVPEKYSAVEKEFLANFRKLSSAERRIVIRMVRSLVIDKQLPRVVSTK